MGLNEELERMKFDTRLVDWNLKHKRIKPEELDKHLGLLADSAGNVDQLSLTADAGVDDLDVVSGAILHS